MRAVPAVLSALLLAACVPATGPDAAPGAVRTDRGNLVVPDPRIPGQFEVFSRPGDAGPDYWCAAAEFADDELDVPANRRIYLVAPRGPSKTQPGRTSAIFTVSPDADLLQAAAALPDSINMDVTNPGRNFLPIHGRAVCRPLYVWPFER